MGKRRTGCKVLVWDGTGLCIFQKRLERGRVAPLLRDEQRELARGELHTCRHQRARSAENYGDRRSSACAPDGQRF